MRNLSASLQDFAVRFDSFTHGCEDLPWARKARAYSPKTSLRDKRCMLYLIQRAVVTEKQYFPSHESAKSFFGRP